jgi:DNA invertase Pin-like site-specific DNA recombinase
MSNKLYFFIFTIYNKKIKLAKAKGKLTIEQVIEIKNLLVQNVSQIKIAKQFNVSSGTINKIKNGVRWKFV